ncbi:cell division protein FtsQ/DivIB [Flavipsychrobacter stenotrophus]|uniref:cell division protein FtsQ/DivIB n=1 Tax=Flavipsychrobacter stenotrophus TaxID=2077091 RepID=UPI000E44CFC9|nr:hypothetical protein [Flavipsychrobacter stenotrophus]
MAVKKKISIRKILQVFTTLVAASACITAIISASKIEGDKKLERVEVHINSGKKYHFIEEKQILDETINNRNIDIMHTPINKLDVQSMERVLKADPWVADASLYIDARRVLHMSVTQRIPVVRIFGQASESYYMDNTLSIMPLSPNFNFYTSVVTNMPTLNNDSVGAMLKKNVLMLVHNIQADTFWNAQVSQIIVDSDYTFELVPVLGDQRIIFGDTSRMKEKFSNLYAFYTNVLNRIGWDKYQTLDVRFKGQVVASPSLPYKGPVDKGAVSMNWINSIVQTEAKMDSTHAIAVEAKAKDVAAKEANKPEAGAKTVIIKKEEKKDPKKDIKKEDKKEPKKDVKADVKKDVKATPKKDIKPEAKKEVKKDPKKEEKKAPVKNIKKEVKKDIKKEVKKVVKIGPPEEVKDIQKVGAKIADKKITPPVKDAKKKEDVSKDKKKDKEPKKAKYTLPVDDNNN